MFRRCRRLVPGSEDPVSSSKCYAMSLDTLGVVRREFSFMCNVMGTEYVTIHWKEPSVSLFLTNSYITVTGSARRLVRSELTLEPHFQI